MLQLFGMRRNIFLAQCVYIRRERKKMRRLRVTSELTIHIKRHAKCGCRMQMRGQHEAYSAWQETRPWRFVRRGIFLVATQSFI